jgi:hypothetical protein
MREDEILDHLDFMLESVELIEKRFSRIRLPEDFVLSLDGATLLDAFSRRALVSNLDGLLPKAIFLSQLTGCVFL